MDISLELIKAYEDGYKNGKKDGYKNGKKDGYEDGKKDAIRYGKWINVSDLDDKVQCRCSECFSGDIYPKDMIVPYCWHCGARMEECSNA